MMRVLSALKWTAAGAAVLLTGLTGLIEADHAFPPPLDAPEVSRQVLDRDGTVLSAFATGEGRWRLPADLDRIDPAFVSMLIAYEDKRFDSHAGIDPLAIGRAAFQLVTEGRIVSGGSTLSMQLARLIEPRESRSFGAKLRQMLRALQIERRLSKREILERYLTLAPYGGNLEGVRAASLAWFGKEPVKLRLSEAALLVALPQLPERRRPDRYPEEARIARNRVLMRMADARVIVRSEIERASRQPLPRGRIAMPQLAPHLARRLLSQSDAAEIMATISAPVQARLEEVAGDAAQKLGPKLSVAMVLADAQTGEVLAHVGSAGFRDDTRAGWIDMTRVARSPGSALKPFIYGLAFEEGLVAAETIMEDRPTDFGGYRPQNFDMGYKGDVSVREALQWSLNVPAVMLLDAVGPQRLAARFRKAGVTLELPRAEAPGLAIGLGGAGITLEDLTALYTGLADGGRTVRLRFVKDMSERPVKADMLTPAASWQVSDILAGVEPPMGAKARRIGFKTGTSYGYRDAWTAGFDGRHVLAVWVGRADNGAVPGLTGIKAAAPILFEAFERSGIAARPMPARPSGAVSLSRADLPAGLRRYAPTVRLASRQTPEVPPQIVYPPQGARVALHDGGRVQPLVLKLQGGRAPFRWLANGRPLDGLERRRESQWAPDGRGTQRLTVIDAAGRTASVELVVD